MAALVHQVVGLGLDDARGQPEVIDPVADDLAQQLAGHLLGVAVEEGIGQRAGARPGQTEDGVAGHGAVVGLPVGIGSRLYGSMLSRS
ncbi:hypothetical protein D9M68_734820 [compost metagenome]